MDPLFRYEGVALSHLENPPSAADRGEASDLAPERTEGLHHGAICPNVARICWGERSEPQHR